MSELTLLIIRIGFLLLLWLFVFSIVYALRSDLFGTPVRKLSDDSGARRSEAAVSTPPQAVPAGIAAAAAPAAAAPVASAVGPGSSTASPQTLAITSGVAAGTTLKLDSDLVTIGRSTDSTLVIVDEYTSTYHARLVRSGTQWLLTDLDSTNGTKLDGRRISGTVPVPPFTPITIGTTTFELRP